jgi:DNA-binding PadR family transcriptional regulator
MPSQPQDPVPPPPLSPATFQVLLALAGEDLHGYAILKRIEERTAGGVRLSTGTLYAMLRRLLAEGLIVERRGRPSGADEDERRRTYRLTPRGREVAVAEAERLDRLVAEARSRRLLGKLRPV